MSYYRSLIQEETISPYLSNLIAYYPFDANANDFSGLGNNGTITGSPTYPLGKVGNAIDFNTSNALIYSTIADSDDFSFTNNTVDLPFSISVWVYVSQFSATYNTILSKRFGANEYEFRIQPSGNIQFIKFSNSSGSILQTVQGGAVLLNTWYNIVVTNLSSNPVNFKMYVNGSLVGTGGNSGAYTRMINTTSVTRVNASVSSLLKHRGLLDEMYIWKNREMSAIEALDIYNKGIAGIALI